MEAKQRFGTKPLHRDKHDPHGNRFAALLLSTVILGGFGLDIRHGLLWGLAGFACFTVAPALGLPPKPPGVPVADVRARQLWWALTAGVTATGLILIAGGGSSELVVEFSSCCLTRSGRRRQSDHKSFPPVLSAILLSPQSSEKWVVLARSRRNNGSVISNRTKSRFVTLDPEFARRSHLRAPAVVYAPMASRAGISRLSKISRSTKE
jgi:hypothetical protein